MKSRNIQCEYYDVGESETYPDGLDSFDNMIYVIDPDLCYDLIENHGRPTYGGEWYYYYGDGCYGTDEDGQAKTNCIRDDHDHSTDPVIIKGDVDGDGVVTIIDATSVQRYIAELYEFTSEEWKRANVDHDYEVTIFDVTIIQKVVAKII